MTSLLAKQHGNLNTLEKDIMDQDSKLEDMSGKVEEDVYKRQAMESIRVLFTAWGNL